MPAAIDDGRLEPHCDGELLVRIREGRLNGNVGVDTCTMIITRSALHERIIGHCAQEPRTIVDASIMQFDAKWRR